MSLNRKGTWLAAWVLVGLLGGASAWAQGLRDADPFAPAEPAHYGGGVRPNEGFFFTYDELLWWLNPPRRGTFGIDNTLVSTRNVFWGPLDTQSFTQGSTMDTSFLKSDLKQGQRYEVGYIQDHVGWLFSYMRLHEFDQDQTLPGVQAFFLDQNWGAAGQPHLTTDFGAGTLRALPVVFDFATLSLTSKVWGTEFDFLLRHHPGEHGGIFEWMFGIRYLQFTEQFDVNASGTPPANSLADTTFTTFGDNEILGPQIGLRWFTTNDRWQLSAEGKFLAGWNSQNVRQNGVVGSDLTTTNFPRPTGFPLAMTATSVDYVTHTSVFSPVAEVRVEGKYMVTKNVAFRAGWNGMAIWELARPSHMVNYELATTHVLGILPHQNHDRAFLQGIELGVEFNR